MKKQWWLIGVGLVVAMVLLFVPTASQNQQIGMGLLGGVLIVFGLAPGRLQSENPRHRCYVGR